MTDRDPDDLRARLAAVDPAASLPPADPARVARLLEDTMARTDVPESRRDGLRRRGPLTWLVAAAAAVLIAGGAVAVITTGDDAPTVADGPGRETTTELLVSPAPAAARCMVPEASPQVVAAQTTVVDAVAERVGDGRAVLRPDRWYAGEPTDTVVVSTPDSDQGRLLEAVAFEEGERYLVAATDGQVTLCGFSARWSEDLAAVYAAAFGD